jgi:PAS domain S-box-containing protein
VASALSSFLLAGTAAVAHRSLEGEIRSALAAGVGALVVANAVFRMGVEPGPEQVTHLGLVLVGLGAFLEGGVFLPLAGLAGVAWLLTVPRYGGLDTTAHFGGYLLGSMVLGCILLVARGYRGGSREGTGEAEDGLSEDLRVSLGWYKKLFLESPALMCVHDGNGRIEEVNPAGLEALNYARQDVVGRNIMEFMVPVTEDGPEQYLRDIQRLGWTEGLLRARRADGRLRVWEYRSTILENGPERLVLATATDVTDLAETPDWVPSGIGARQA